MNQRLLIIILAAAFILISTLALIQFAKGYRPDLQTGEIKPTGLLVATSEPKAAQVFVNGQLKTATDDTFTLEPGTYQIEIKKEGFIPWTKQLSVEKELVTQTNAVLFPSTPNLQSLTNSGALNPSLSPNGTKLLYVIPADNDNQNTLPSDTVAKDGLWLIELTNLPLGFNQDPKQLVVGTPSRLTRSNLDWSNAQLVWSPDSRELLAIFFEKQNEKSQTKDTNTNNQQSDISNQVPHTVYRISTSNTATTATQLTNISSRHLPLLTEWAQDADKILQNQIDKLPIELASLLAASAANLRFSPDETKLLYTATASAQLANQYIPPLPAASTQTQIRTLQPNNTYIYDLKEDRNFLVLNEQQTTALTECETAELAAGSQQPTATNLICHKLSWFPTSSHLLHFANNKINIMEYDSTNSQVIYSGPIEQNHVFTHPSPSKLLIVTNLNPDSFPLPNLYTLSLR